MNIKNIKNISTLIRGTKGFITANSPTLLVGAAVTGIVTTGYLSAKAGYNAHAKVIEEELSRTLADMSPEAVDEFHNAYGEDDNKLSLQEKAQLTWPLYVVPVLTASGSVAACVGVHTIHTKRHAALAGLYAVASTKLDDYQEKAEELLGSKKVQTLTNETAQGQIDRHPEFIDNEVILTGKGTDLWYDELSGRYFESSLLEVETAINEVNLQLAENGDADLNDMWSHLGLTHLAPLGDTYGWNGGTRVTGKFGSVKTPDGRSAMSLYFLPSPEQGFDQGNR